MFAEFNFYARSDGPRYFVLTQPMTYIGKIENFVVPVGSKTDFATVPRVFRWLVSGHGIYTRAAILHDYLCLNPQEASRADADGIFRRVLGELGVSNVLRYMMWAGVRSASNMAGATRKDWFDYILVTIPSAIFLSIPAIIICLWLLMLKLVE